MVGDRGPVRIVALDVTLPGLHHGAVSEEGAAWLDRVLAAEPTRPTIVMMHQPPFDTGMPYLDPYSCRDGQRLAAVVARHPQVERIVCGHVHRVHAASLRRHDAVHRAVDDDDHCAAAPAGRQAGVAHRAAGHAAASLAGRDGADHALRPDRDVPRTVSLRLSGRWPFAREDATAAALRHYLALMRTLEIVHRTRYEYSEPVSLGDHRLMFRPRDSHDLRLLNTGLMIEPVAQVRYIHDPFGNSIAIASFEGTTQVLELVSTIQLEHFGVPPGAAADRRIRPHLAVQLRGRGGT